MQVLHSLAHFTSLCLSGQKKSNKKPGKGYILLVSCSCPTTGSAPECQRAVLPARPGVCAIFFSLSWLSAALMAALAFFSDGRCCDGAGPAERDVPPLLMRMNLLGPLLPHSFPFAVNASMMLWISAFVGMATTCVLGIVGWSIIFIPAGNFCRPQSLLSLGCLLCWSSCLCSCLGAFSSWPLFSSLAAVLDSSFCGRVSFRLLRIKGLRGLVLIIDLYCHSPLKARGTNPAKQKVQHKGCSKSSQDLPQNTHSQQLLQS